MSRNHIIAVLIIANVGCATTGAESKSPYGAAADTGRECNGESDIQCGRLVPYTEFVEFLTDLAFPICAQGDRCSGVEYSYRMEGSMETLINDYSLRCNWTGVNPCEAAQCVDEWTKLELVLQVDDQDCEEPQQIPEICIKVIQDMNCEPQDSSG